MYTTPDIWRIVLIRHIMRIPRVENIGQVPGWYNRYRFDSDPKAKYTVDNDERLALNYE